MPGINCTLGSYPGAGPPCAMDAGLARARRGLRRGRPATGAEFGAPCSVMEGVAAATGVLEGASARRGMLEVPSNGALEPTFEEEGADEGFIAPLPCRGVADGPVGRGPCSEARGLTDLGPGEDARRGEFMNR